MAFPRKKHPKCNHKWIQALDQWHLMYGQICYARIKPFQDRYSMTAMAYNAKFYINDGNLDHDSSNHDVSLERLRALCQGCHLKYDLHRHILKRRFGKDFFKIQLNLFENGNIN